MPDANMTPRQWCEANELGPGDSVRIASVGTCPADVEIIAFGSEAVFCLTSKGREWLWESVGADLTYTPLPLSPATSQ